MLSWRNFFDMALIERLSVDVIDFDQLTTDIAQLTIDLRVDYWTDLGRPSSDGAHRAFLRALRRVNTVRTRPHYSRDASR